MLIKAICALRGHHYLPAIIGGDMYIPSECMWCGKLRDEGMKNTEERILSFILIMLPIATGLLAIMILVGMILFILHYFMGVI